MYMYLPAEDSLDTDHIEWVQIPPEVAYFFEM